MRLLRVNNLRCGPNRLMGIADAAAAVVVSSARSEELGRLLSGAAGASMVTGQVIDQSKQLASQISFV